MAVPGLSFSSSVASRSGDASGGLDAGQPFQYNSSFQVGGSGEQSQTQSASQTPGGEDSTRILLYAGIGLAVLATIGLAVYIIKK